MKTLPYLILFGLMALPFQGWSQCGTVGFSYSKQSECGPASIVLTANGLPPGATVVWTINGTIVDSGAVATHMLPGPGVFTAGMLVTLANGTTCPVQTAPITLQTPPSLGYTVSPDISALYCSGPNPFQFQATSSGQLTGAIWVIDQTNYFGTSATHTFYNGGWKKITVQGIDTSGCAVVLQDSLYLNLSTPPNVEVKYLDSGFCAPAILPMALNSLSGTPVLIDTLTVKLIGPSPVTYTYVNQLSTSLANLSIPLNDSGTYKVQVISKVGLCTFSTEGDEFYVEKPYVPDYSFINGQKVDTICYRGNTSVSIPNSKDPFTKYFRLNGAANNAPLLYQPNMPGLFDLFLVRNKPCQDTFQFPGVLTVLGPKAQFTSTNRLSCSAPHTVNLTSTAVVPSSGVNTYQWYFLDSANATLGTATGPTASFAFPNTGEYSASLVVSNSSSGCSDSVLYKNYIKIGLPIATVDTTKILKCAPATFQWQNFGVLFKQTAAFTLQLLDSNGVVVKQSNSLTKKDTLHALGPYKLRMIFANAPGCKDTLEVDDKLWVTGMSGKVILPSLSGCLNPPNNQFTFQPLLDSVVFFPKPTSGATGYYWNITPIGLGNYWLNNPTLPSPTMSVTQAGTYVVSLTLNGCNTEVYSDTLKVGVLTRDYFPFAYHCTGTANQVIPYGPPFNVDSNSTFSWTATGGSVQFFPNAQVQYPWITFPSEGDYQLFQTVTNAAGCSSTSGTSVLAYDLKHTLSASDTFVACGPYPIKFKSEANTYNAHHWTINGFGQNNLKITTQYPNDSLIWFVTSGKYQISCVAEGFEGCTDSAFIEVEVGGPLPRFWPITNNAGCAPFNVAFADTSHRVDSLYFQFGDGSPGLSLGSYPVGDTLHHTYAFPYNQVTTDSVMYEASLLALSNTCPNPIIAKQKIIVYGSPQVGYQHGPTEGCAPLPFSFTDASTFVTGATFILNFGDGTIDSNSTGNFSHIYSTPGEYSPIYTIINAYGCQTDSILPFKVFAIDTPHAGFMPSTGIACWPLSTIQFTDTSFAGKGNTITRRKWDFGDPTTLADTSNLKNPSYTYPGPGLYTPTLTVYNNRGCSNTFALPYPIDVADSTPPDLNPLVVVSVANQQWNELVWQPSQDLHFAAYHLERNTGNGFAPVSQVKDPSVTQWIDPIHNPANGWAGYRIYVRDTCNLMGPASAEHRTIYLTASTTLPGTVDLEWTPYVGLPNGTTRVYFREEGIAGWDSLPASPQATQAVVSGLCDGRYEFEVRTRFGPLVSHSNRVTLQPEYTLPSSGPALDRVSVAQVGNTLMWQHTAWPRRRGYRLWRRESSGPWDSTYAFIPGPSFTDGFAQGDQHWYGYRLQMEDSCGKYTPPGPESRTMLLTWKPADDGGIALDWTPYVGWPEGIDRYEVLRMEADGQNRVISSTPNLSAEDRTPQRDMSSTVKYTIRAHRKGMPTTSLSNTVEAAFGPRLFIPDAFSPNGDGLNDAFDLGALGLEEFHIRIFDRWGSLIFESQDAGNAWDGRDATGKPAMGGVYTYILKGRAHTGQAISQTGQLTLVR